jgi:ABC-type Na+ efflux pump permease subunit
MKLNRIIAYLMGCLAFASSFIVYTKYIYLLGFPDGFITELGYAERKLAYIFIGISLILGVYFIYLGAIAGRKKIAKQLTTTIILHMIFIISSFIIDRCYHLHFV